MDRCNGDESWNWLEENFLLAKDNDLGKPFDLDYTFHYNLDAFCNKSPVSVDIPECLWDNATCEEDLSYILEESSSTPIRACNGVPYDYNHHRNSNKASEVCIETCPPIKRRRTLHFNNEELEDLSFLKSKETMDSVDVAVSNVPERVPRLEVEDISSSGIECLDHFDGWLTDCLNQPDTQFSPDDMLSSGSSEGYSDSTVSIRHGSSSALISQANDGYARPVQQNIRPCGNIILKGRKSYMTAPTRLGSSIAYPFTFIKPSVANGDVTLTDINQRIRTPPKTKEEFSAITGKPVVTKTRIRTDGGRGSITIMRTKG